MNEVQNDIGENDGSCDKNEVGVKNSNNGNAKEKIIVAAVILAGVWSVFFAAFGNALPSAFSLKEAVVKIASKASHTAKNAAKKGILSNKKYKKAKDFSLVGLDGNIVSLSDLKGKAVFIDFWASWYPPCRDSIPAVKKLHAKMKNNSNVVVLSVNCGEEKNKVSDFVKKEGMAYPVLMSDGSVEKNYRVSGIPRFVIIDRNGNIVNEYSGWHPSYADKWEKDIKEALSLERKAFTDDGRPPLSDLSGKQIDIAEYRGKTLFLAFWFMSSYPCRQASPYLKTISDKISKTPNAKFFSVNVDSKQENLRYYIDKNNIKYPVLRATKEFADSYGVSSAYPACIIVDKNGKVVKRFFGYSEGDQKEWEKAFNEVLKSK
ncbi:MAG: TlpA family protein disulfide reductase [Endomicrobium sp.]|jgi:thiol-disulfide isomerase/thioredoxin|nr:TlpA family protein disulfide reductase [Endomicrobium sp.]